MAEDTSNKNNDQTEPASSGNAPDDDIIGYIQPGSLESLKSRFSAAEEDESIRREGFELARKSGLIVKKRPESSFPYDAAPVKKRDDIVVDPLNGGVSSFEEARSSLTGVDVDFTEIVLDSPGLSVSSSTDAAVPSDNTSSVAEEPPKPKKRGRPRKIKSEPKTDTDENISSETSEGSAGTFSENMASSGNKYGYNTHTRVIYTDDEPEDGIVRNDNDEIESLLMSEKKKRRSLFSRKKRG